MAWPKDTQADNKLLDNIMKYLESETIKNEGELEIARFLKCYQQLHSNLDLYNGRICRGAAKEIDSGNNQDCIFKKQTHFE